MACNPTRIELSNSAATTLTVTLTSDPGDGVTVLLIVDALGISVSGTTSGGSATLTPVSAVVADTNSLWDAVIQVGLNRPAVAEILITETNTAQNLGITITDSEVTYCAPMSGGGGSGTVTSITPAADNGSGTAITTSGTITITGGETIDTTVSGTEITIVHGTPTAPTPSISYTWPTGFDVDEFGHIVAVAASKTPLVPDQNLADVDDAAAARSNLGLVIGTDVADAAAAVPVGGTTGQVLAKASATDYDTQWVAAGGTGTVTSVGLNVPGGFTVSGTNPITTAGTFEITSTLDGIIKGDGAATFSGDAELNDLADVNVAQGAGNDGDLLYYDHAAGAGNKFKGIARSSIGLSEFDNDLPAVQDSYLMLIEAPSDKTYIIDGRCAAARTVTNFYAKTSTGTCTATLKNVTDTTTIGTISVTSTGGSAASLSNTAIGENDRISIEISSNNSSEDLELVVEYTQ
jgi:hypothetical protein